MELNEQENECAPMEECLQSVPVVPHCTLQNMETGCCCICCVPGRGRHDMKALHIGEKLVSAKYAKDKQKLNDHMP